MSPLAAIKNRLHVHEAFVRTFDNEEWPDGKIVLRSICREGFVFKTTFVAGDPHQTALNEGARRLALSILGHTYRDHGELINQVEELVRQEHE